VTQKEPAVEDNFQEAWLSKKQAEKKQANVIGKCMQLERGREQD
jgi:hypothetical protein